MAINTQLLIAAPMLQDYFVDKETGLPLAAGIVKCYKDDDRLVFKNWYYQSGSPGSYTYVALDNPLTLSASGTITDPSGNDTIPFFYPYDEDDFTIAQSYYVTVVNEELTAQFVRQNFPFVNAGADSQADQNLLNNLMPNGQFLAHIDLPDDGLIVNGTQQIDTTTFGTAVLGSSTSVIIAQGGSVGWYFIKDFASTSTDVITFIDQSTETTDVIGNPKYLLNINCTSPSGSDTFKELRVRFNNVNHFSSGSVAPNGYYSIGFQGENLAVGTQAITLNYIKYFGTGGSDPVETPITTFTCQNGTFESFTYSLQFPLNTVETIGSEDDDYIEISISLPIGMVFNLSFSGFVMIPGSTEIISYPEVPDYQVFSQVVGSMPTPNPDGSDLYCPLVLTPGGTIFSHADIGKIYATMYLTPNIGELVCNGAGLITTDYSTDGIPYSRLQPILWNDTIKAPICGTGPDYLIAYQGLSTTNQLRIHTNKAGAETVAADGALATGFTFSTIHEGGTTNLGGYVFQTSESTSTSVNILAVANTDGGVTNAADVDTTMIITPLRNSKQGSALAPKSNTSETLQTFAINAIAAASLAAPGAPGLYFTFTSANPGGGSTNYHVWFKTTNETPPPGPGTAIQINLISTYTSREVASLIAGALSGYTMSSVTCLAASSITTGTYFNIHANSITYNVWYKKAGTGTAPSNGNINIMVELVGSETSAQVAVLTQIAINSYSYALPNIVQGMFLRAIDSNGTWDLENYARWSNVDTHHGENLGTFELHDALQHYHYESTPLYENGASGTRVGCGDEAKPVTDQYLTFDTGAIGLTGQNVDFGNGTAPEVAYPNASHKTLIPPASQTETRPVNFYVNYVIKY